MDYSTGETFSPARVANSKPLQLSVIHQVVNIQPTPNVQPHPHKTQRAPAQKPVLKPPCRTCYSMGHITKDCQICRYCGQLGHKKYKCPNRPPPSCVECRGQHKTRQCPIKRGRKKTVLEKKFRTNPVLTTRSLPSAVENNASTTRNAWTIGQDNSPAAQNASPTVQDNSSAAQNALPTGQDSSSSVKNPSPTRENSTPIVQNLSPTVQNDLPPDAFGAFNPPGSGCVVS